MRQPEVKVSNPVEELFFVIAPPPHIKSDVSVLKDDVQYLIGREYEGRYSTAHISLFKFDDKRHFDEIIREVERKALHFKPFNIFVKDMGLFHHGALRTIILEIVNKCHVQDVFEKLVKKASNYTPHITIAKKLEPDDVLRAWPYLEGFQYSQHFLCDRITVLARRQNRWIHYKDIPFGS